MAESFYFFSSDIGKSQILALKIISYNSHHSLKVEYVQGSILSVLQALAQ